MTYWRLYYHIVWATKHREPVIDEARATFVKRTLEGLAQQEGVFVHAVGVMPDHVHLAVSIPPRHAVAAIVNTLKGSSSHLINRRETGPDHEWPGWQSEYGALSFGQRALPEVVEYVVNQQERHARRDLLPALERIDAR